MAWFGAATRHPPAAPHAPGGRITTGAADDLDKLHPLHHAVQAQAHKDIVGALYLANPDSARYGVPSSLGGPLRGELAPEGATSGVYDDDGNLIPL